VRGRRKIRIKMKVGTSRALPVNFFEHHCAIALFVSVRIRIGTCFHEFERLNYLAVCGVAGSRESTNSRSLVIARSALSLFFQLRLPGL
jgi:hypothetical protein